MHPWSGWASVGRRFDQRSVLVGLLIVTTALILWTLLFLRSRRRRLESLTPAERRVVEAQAGAGSIDSQARTRLALIGGLIVVLSSVVILFAVTTKSSLNLQVGDCVTVEPNVTFQTVAAIPCALPHGNEIYAVIEIPAPSGAPWPGDTSLRAAAEPGCEAAYATFIGAPYIRSSRWWISIFVPEDPYWAIGVRSTWCTVANVKGAQTSGSARGTGN